MLKNKTIGIDHQNAYEVKARYAIFKKMYIKGEFRNLKVLYSLFKRGFFIGKDYENEELPKKSIYVIKEVFKIMDTLFHDNWDLYPSYSALLRRWQLYFIIRFEGGIITNGSGFKHPLKNIFLHVLLELRQEGFAFTKMSMSKTDYTLDDICAGYIHSHVRLLKYAINKNTLRAFTNASEKRKRSIADEIYRNILSKYSVKLPVCKGAVITDIMEEMAVLTMNIHENCSLEELTTLSKFEDFRLAFTNFMLYMSDFVFWESSKGGPYYSINNFDNEKIATSTHASMYVDIEAGYSFFRSVAQENIQAFKNCDVNIVDGKVEVCQNEIFDKILLKIMIDMYLRNVGNVHMLYCIDPVSNLPVEIQKNSNSNINLKRFLKQALNFVGGKTKRTVEDYGILFRGVNYPIRVYEKPEDVENIKLEEKLLNNLKIKNGYKQLFAQAVSEIFSRILTESNIRSQAC